MISVTIPPYKYLVEKITGDDFNINIIVPPGLSPETYEPTPSDIINIKNSLFSFQTDLLSFEKQLFSKYSANGSDNFINITKDIKLINEQCYHNHHGHSHLEYDPHIWLSPENLKVISRNIYNTVITNFPDSTKYTDNYTRLLKEINAVDSIISGKIKTVTSFLIFHPAYTYFAKDYGIKQISIEQDGKEPSVTKMKEIISEAKNNEVRKIFYQKEFSRSVVETIAKDIGAEIIEIDPLEENVLEGLLRLTDLLIK